MILDTSALAAIFFGEPEAARYTRLIVENILGHIAYGGIS